MAFRPMNEKQKALYAVEKVRVDTLRQIMRVMKERGVSQAELAIRLGVTDARVSQYFSPSSNLTLRTVAQIFHALDDECRIASLCLDEAHARVTAARARLAEAEHRLRRPPSA